jgi:drug/metabolite transporter (DMT)-like permease
VVTITLVMLLLRKPLQLWQIPWGPMIVVGLLQTTVPWILIAFSETKITSSMASVLNASTPLWTLITGVLLFQLKSSRNLPRPRYSDYLGLSLFG